MGKKIYFTVTNDLSYDQRMHRICSSLSATGYQVTLVGRKLSGSSPLSKTTYMQKRIRCWFTRGRWFYREYSLRLFLFLLFKRMDAVCAIDLDTILPCLYVSRLKNTRRVYDAHELFTELKEVVTRNAVHRTWLKIEKKAVPAFSFGYTVSESIAAEFQRRYAVEYSTIRNVPVLREWVPVEAPGKFILYQGAVNEARGFEWLIPAMQGVNSRLVICGDGNFMSQLKELIKKYRVENKVELRGLVGPDELWHIARSAHLGVAVAEKTGLNQYFALPNKFFDYIHAGLPQVTMDYPEYRKINAQHEVAILIDDLSPERIAAAINKLLHDDVLHTRLRQNCLEQRIKLTWQ
jgi:glycosyltransferase involved in cell wall biosynthesis